MAKTTAKRLTKRTASLTGMRMSSRMKSLSAASWTTASWTTRRTPSWKTVKVADSWLDLRAEASSCWPGCWADTGLTGGFG